MDHLAYYAVINGHKQQFLDHVRATSGNSHFNIEESDNGHVSTTALQGPACKKLIGIGYNRDEDAIARLVDSAGIVNGGKTIVNDNKNTAKVAKMCRTILKDGTRCPNNHAAKGIQCAGCTASQLRKNTKFPMCGAKENPQMRQTTATLRDDYVALGKTMQTIFPAITQVDPYFDDMYEVLMEGAIEGVDEFYISGDHLDLKSAPPPALLAAEKDRRVSRRRSRDTDGNLIDLVTLPVVFAKILEKGDSVTSNERIRGKWVKNVRKVRTAEQQMEKLEAACKEFGDRWKKTIGDERVTAYCHMVAAHACPLMRKHKSLGKFSNSVIESFHKKVRFFYQRTNRGGGVEGKESAYAVMQKMIGLQMLEIERREGGRQLINVLTLAATGNRADCGCALGFNSPCSWTHASQQWEKVVEKRLRETEDM